MRSQATRELITCQAGATALEFALVAPAFISFILSIFHLSFLALTIGSLHYTVEKGARCAALRAPADCPAETFYFAPGPAPVFTYTVAPCGTSLSAEVAYQLNVVLYQGSVPLRASACFP